MKSDPPSVFSARAAAFLCFFPRISRDASDVGRSAVLLGVVGYAANIATTGVIIIVIIYDMAC